MTFVFWYFAICGALNLLFAGINFGCAQGNDASEQAIKGLANLLSFAFNLAGAIIILKHTCGA